VRTSRRKTKKKSLDGVAIEVDDYRTVNRLLLDNNTENNPSLVWHAQITLVVKGFIAEYEEAPLV
jgi:hypothetical protein